MSETVFNTAFNLILINEGGYVNDPHDKGGETKYGISKRAYPNIDIKNLTLEQARAIYHRDYWLRCKCEFLPDALSVAVFDYAVNSGVKRAIKDLQRSLGVSVDGIIGNQTVCAANRIPQRKVLSDYLDKRLNYLMSLKSWARYGNGWGNRVKRVREFCEGLI